MIAALIVALTMQTSPLSNRTYDKATASRPPVERAWIYQPTHEWLYSHHAHLAYFKGRYVAIWSNGKIGEDDPGQRVLTSTSKDFLHWTPPAVLSDPNPSEAILTAAGFHQYRGTLVAYYGQYSDQRTETHLFARTSTDGVKWSEPTDLHVPCNPNHGPQTTKSGRLIICGNFAFPYTDDPSGLKGWKWTGFQTRDLDRYEDNPWAFWKIQKEMKMPVALCEGSFFQTDDGTLHMPLRVAGESWAGYLWETESKDNGMTWSRPIATDFSDNDAKFHFGRLPDGRFYYIGNPDRNKPERNPLVLSLSKDGVHFDRHFILADSHYSLMKEGKWKGGQYGYPHSIIADGCLCVIVSRQKEAMEVLRVKLDDLS